MEKGQVLYQDIGSNKRQELQPELMSMMKEEVGRARESRIPIIRAFEAVAKRSGLKANTIRNYYYRYLHAHELKDRRSTTVVSDEETVFTSDAIGRAFTPAETKKLMREMLIAQGRGESVRGCANRLSGGDKRVLIRLQNKYRSVIAREPDYVREVIRELEREGIVCFNPYTRRRIKGIASGSMQGPAGNDGQFLELVGQLVNNLKAINLSTLHDLMAGLRDLSSLAAGNSSGLDWSRDELDRLSARYDELANVCRDFLALSDTDKLAELSNYVDRLKACLAE